MTRSVRRLYRGSPQSRGEVNHFGDVGGMVADPLQVPGDEQQGGSAGVMLCGFSIMWVSSVRKILL